MRKLQKLWFIPCLFLSLFSVAQTREIRGTVTSEKGPVVGASVIVSGETTGTSTNADGNFSIRIPSGKASLVVSSVGYATKQVAVSSNESQINITLEESKSELQEVVVTALGIKREKKSLTYATQQIDGDEITKAGNTNFMNALSGKVAGVNISVSNSGAGGSTKAVLRGNKSLNGTSEALYVIDGVPMVNNKGGQRGSYGGTDGGDGLSAINPADIESVSILRGASAAILYGSQGANGVVLITTKKGRAGKVAIDFSSTNAFDQVSGLPDFQYRYGTVGGDYSWTPVPANTPGTDLINISKSPVQNVQSNN